MARSEANISSHGEPSLEEVKKLVAKTPLSGKKRSIGLLALVATFGSLLFGYDTGVISAAFPFMYMPHAAGGFHLSALEEGLVGAFLAFGAAFGAFYGGRLSDRYGRRHNITLLAIIFILGTLGCVFSVSLWMLYPCRFILGIAVGGASATVPVYLSENAPQRVRGPLVAVDQFMIVFGQLLAYAINAVITTIHGGPQVTLQNGQTMSWDDAEKQHLAEQVVSGNGIAWHYMLLVATLPAIALWIGIRLMPESSRWYAANGHYVEAIGALKRLRDESKDDVAAEIEEMIEIHRAEEQQENWTLRQVFQTKWTRKILLIGVCLGLFDQLTGINTAMWYMPKILSAAGFPTTEGILLNVVTGTVAAIGSALGFIAVAKLYRRTVGIIQETGITISLAVLGFVFLFGFSKTGELLEGAPKFLPWVVLIVISIFVFMKQTFTVHWVILAEIFPAKVRGAAQGASVAALWFMNGIIILAFPIMMKSLGGSITYFIFAIINFVALVFYIKVVPETKTQSLEGIEKQLMKKYS